MKIRTITSILMLAVVANTAIVIASGRGWNPFDEKWNFTNSGAFGDSFGPLNTLMAALAALGALAAYFAQKEDLEQTKGELLQERDLAIKRDFENTFFNLLRLSRETLAEIEVTDSYGENPKKGRDAIERIVREEYPDWQAEYADDSIAYQKLYSANRDDLGHYFRILYQVTRFIDESQVADKMFYVRILRANLSNCEMILLGLNAVHGGGYPKFKKLIEQYALLHNISSSMAISHHLHESLASTAFGDRDLLADSVN